MGGGWPLFCDVVLSFLADFAIIPLMKKWLIALL